MYQKQKRIKLSPHKFNQLCEKVWERDEWTCQGKNCDGEWPLDIKPHHIIFKSHGGQDTEENLITLCMKCHSAKHGINLKK